MVSVSGVLSQLLRTTSADDKGATYSLDYDTSDLVRVSIASWPSVLKVSLSFPRALSWNPDTGATVGHAPAETLDATGLVTTGQTLLVALSVHGNVLFVALLELLHGGFDVLHSTLIAHFLGGDVGVETGTVPVTRDGLGVEGDLGAKLFGNAAEKETSHPEVIANW